MKITDKVRFYSALLNVALTCAVCFLIYLLLQKEGFDCSDCEGTVTIQHDTIWPHNQLKPIVVKVPEVKKAIVKRIFNQATISKTETVEPTLSHNVWFSEDSCQGQAASSVPSPCDTVNMYSDTTISRMPDSCVIVVNDTLIDNKIAGRSVWFESRIPQINTTITKTLKEKWKFYVGGSFTVNARYMQRWGAGPSAVLTIPKIGGIGYTFDIKNTAHTGSFLALLRFKR